MRQTGTSKPKRSATSRRKGRPAKPTQKVGSEKVVDTARLLLRQSRPPQVTRAEVAKAAGVDQKLIRYYFENYDDLLDQVVDLSIKELDAVMTAASRPQKTATAVLRERVRALTDFLAENPTFFKILVDRVYGGAGAGARERLETMNSRAYERHRVMMEFGRANGEFRTDFDPRFLYLVIIAMAEFFTTGRPVIEYLFRDKAERVRKRYEAFVVDLILNGIAPQPKEPVKR